LATAVSTKENPTDLPNSALQLRTTKELLEFFTINSKEYVIHIILKQKDRRISYEEDFLKDLPPPKREPPIKKGKGIKKENKLELKQEIKQEVKQEVKKVTTMNQQASTHESSISEDPQNEPSTPLSSHRRTISENTEEFEEAYPSVDTIVQQSTKTKLHHSPPSPLARRTRRQRLTQEEAKAE
jgi:hypothetical protein